MIIQEEKNMTKYCTKLIFLNTKNEHSGIMNARPTQHEVQKFAEETLFRQYVFKKIYIYTDFTSAKTFVKYKKEHSNLNSFKRLVKVAFKMNLEGKQRRYKLEDILRDLEKYSGSSEAIRQTSTENP